MTVSQAAVDDWHAAVRLQEHLRAGHRATPVSGLVSPAGEPAFARLDGALDVMQGERLALRSSDPTTHAAARQWRPVMTGDLWLVSSRLHLVGVDRDVSQGWQGLTAMHTDTMGLVLTYGLDEFRVRVHCPTWLQVMVMHIGFGVVTNLVAPSWARERRPD